MDYSDNAAMMQMPGRANASLSGGICKSPQPPRTFGELQGIVSRLRATRNQINDMLDRVSQQPPQDTAQGLSIGQLGASPYADSISEIGQELDRVGSLLDQLGRHV